MINALNKQVSLLTKEVEALRGQNKANNKLLSVVLHDLRTPLAGLSGILTLINNNMISEQQFKTFCRQLSKDMLQLQTEADNLLQWCLTQFNDNYTKPYKVSLTQLIKECMFFLKQVGEQKNISIVRDVEEELYVFADANYVKIVLRNLLSNAIKYSFPGQEVKVSAHKENEYVRVVVQDRGVGMTDETKDALMNNELLASEYGTLNEKGAGVGLMLVKEFCERNNGSLRVISERGKGTIFIVKLLMAQ
jgi:signal transduction histidine kinase